MNCRLKPTISRRVAYNAIDSILQTRRCAAHSGRAARFVGVRIVMFAMVMAVRSGRSSNISARLSRRLLELGIR
jgi:hypothetical protein